MPKFNPRQALEITWRVLVFAVAVGILIVVATRWNRWEGSPGWQTTDDAYLQADITPISSKVPGYLQSFPEQDYEHVHAGQILAQIVQSDYLAAVAQGEANVASARALAQSYAAQIELQHANIAAAVAAAATTQASLDQNSRDLARQRRLLAGGSASVASTEKLQTTRAELNATLAQNRAQIDAAKGQLGVLAADVAEAKAAIAAARAALLTARINLGYTNIIAPVDGIIGARQVKPGQLVGAGTQITTLTPLPNLWVVANYKETQLTHMAIGNQARITVDTFPGRTLLGHVIAFAPGSGAEFALLPPDNATGNFTKVVQRVVVKIAIDDADGLTDRLVPGLSVIARVDAEDGTK